jgi:hypothetical protein
MYRWAKATARIAGSIAPAAVAAGEVYQMRWTGLATPANRWRRWSSVDVARRAASCSGRARDG